MSSKTLLSLTLAVLLGLHLHVFFSQEADARNSQRSAKIGFVDLKTLLKDYKKAREMEREIQQETRAETNKIRAMEEKAKQLREEIPLYRVGSKVRQRKGDELTDIMFQIKHMKEKTKYFALVRLKAGMEKIYREIDSVIEKYAKKHNFHMIIKVEQADFFDTNSNEALQMEINTRDVLYWNDRYDITHSISKILNKSS